MAQILIRDLEKETVDKLKELARLQGRSLQAEAKMILQRAVAIPKVDMETARKQCEEFALKFKDRKFPDSVDLIREDRDR